jgi:hypothetical protein
MRSQVIDLNGPYLACIHYDVLDTVLSNPIQSSNYICTLLRQVISISMYKNLWFLIYRIWKSVYLVLQRAFPFICLVKQSLQYRSSVMFTRKRSTIETLSRLYRAITRHGLLAIQVYRCIGVRMDG